jgi:3,4-dihydroxy 2-butanone 4-phosphate synthase / GTP cyclohydrolase II
VNSEALTEDLAQPIAAALQQLRAGGPVVITDAIRDIGVAGIAGSRTTPDNVNFLIGQCRGIVYAGASRAQLTNLRIGHQHGADVMRSHVYVAVDAIENVTTGVSAADRSTTIATIIDPKSTRAQLRTPGHVLPTVIDTSGQLERFYFNEALQYLVGLAGLGEGLALSAVLAVDGSMASVGELRTFAAEHAAPLPGHRRCAASPPSVGRLAGPVARTAHGESGPSAHRCRDHRPGRA